MGRLSMCDFSRHDRQASSLPSSMIRRVAVLAMLVIGVACESTGPAPNMTGLWEARVDFLAT
jgi:hypothetical protein